MIKTPKSVSPGVYTGGTNYWKITWGDGKSDNVISDEFKNIIAQAIEGKYSVEVKKNKVTKDGKDYWNIIDIIPQSGLETPPQPLGAKTSPANKEPDVVTEAKKLGAKVEEVINKEDSINKAVAFKGAIELVSAILQSNQIELIQSHLKEGISKKVSDLTKTFTKLLREEI